MELILGTESTRRYMWTRAMLDTFRQLLMVPTVGSWPLVREAELDDLRSLV